MSLGSRLASLLLVLLLLVLVWTQPMDAAASDQVEAGLKRALTTFAAARALNAVISVAQGTEVALEPAGVGVTFTPGQILDPVNDLVEQFSSLMLVASVSFGVQRTLLAVGGHWVISALVTGLLLAWLWQRWRGNRRLDQWLLLALLLRFAIPAVTLGSEAMFQWFLSERYQASQAALSLGTEQVSELTLTPPTDQPAASWGERAQRWWTQAGSALDVGARMEALKQSATAMTEHIIELIVVFLLQTLILPLGLLWLGWRACLALPRREPSE
ncbi:MAG: hypothetical protein MUE46_08565 [Xanthomonadales bacterium]|jgi:hypothetical protein|nr:hypothetical protein [Xanthomonadales bacterium]